jgi:predicted metal-dependent phosphotriesterase family hydrolase
MDEVCTPVPHLKEFHRAQLNNSVRHEKLRLDCEDIAAMVKAMTTAIQYLIDETGEKTGVILSISDYERLTEDVQDLADIVDRRKEPTIAHNDFLAQLRADGLLQD